MLPKMKRKLEKGSDEPDSKKPKMEVKEVSGVQKTVSIFQIYIWFENAQHNKTSQYITFKKRFITLNSNSKISKYLFN